MLLPLFLMSCLNKDNNIVSLLKEEEVSRASVEADPRAGE